MITTIALEELHSQLYSAAARDRLRDTDALPKLLRSLEGPELRESVRWVQRCLCDEGSDDVNRGAVGELAGRQPQWPDVGEVAGMLDDLVGADALVDPMSLLRDYALLVTLPLAAAEQLAPEARETLLGPLRELRRRLPSARGDEATGAGLRERLDALTGTQPLDPTGLPYTVLDDDDDFGPAMRAAYPELLASPGIADLLGACRTMDSVRANKRRRAEAARLLTAAPHGAEVVRTLLEDFARQGEHLVVTDALYGAGRRSPGIAGDGNARLVCGLVWAALGLDGEWVAPLIGAVALNAGTGLGGSGGMCRHSRIATTAVASLGVCEGLRAEQAVTWLGRIQAKVRNRTVLKNTARALQQVAAGAGLTPGQLRERTVPALGLEAHGERELVLGTHAAVLSVTPGGSASLTFRDEAGEVMESVPKAMRAEHAAELSELRSALKELRALLPLERRRLEEHLVAGTVWAAHVWSGCYLDHPVTGALARDLVWEASTDGGAEWTAGLPEQARGGWALAAEDGTAAEIGPGALIRLWHPIRPDADTVEAWQEAVAERELLQPFKQVFREIFPLSAEEWARSRSDRFAGHVVRYGQAKALMVERGWSGGTLGHFSDGYQGEAVRELPEADGEAWRARFFIGLVGCEEDRWSGPSYASTGQVCFERRLADGGRGWSAAALAAVPPLVLSEALRDVALFVASASEPSDTAEADVADPEPSVAGT